MRASDEILKELFPTYFIDGKEYQGSVLSDGEWHVWIPIDPRWNLPSAERQMLIEAKGRKLIAEGRLK